jgi:hypothetical protein
VLVTLRERLQICDQQHRSIVEKLKIHSLCFANRDSFLEDFMECAPKAIEDFSLRLTLPQETPYLDNAPAEAASGEEGGSQITYRCDVSARRALQEIHEAQSKEDTRLPAVDLRLFGVYASEHKEFFDCWEEHFTRFEAKSSRYHQEDSLLREASALELSKKYEETVEQFSAQWQQAVYKLALTAKDEATQAYVSKILKEAQVRERLASEWIEKIVASFKRNDERADEPAQREQGVAPDATSFQMNLRANSTPAHATPSMPALEANRSQSYDQ